MSFLVPSSSTPKRQTSMNAEQPFKRPYSQIDTNVDPSELPPYQANAGMKSINLHSHSPILRPCLANYLGELHLGLATKTESRLMPRNPQSDYVSIRYVSSILVTFTTCITLPHHAKPFAPPPTASQHRAMMTASAVHPKQSVREISTTNQSVY